MTAETLVLVQAQVRATIKDLKIHPPFVRSQGGKGGLTSILLQKTWCVAKPSSDESTLLANINYACSQVDCIVLQRGKPCFFPDTFIAHASVAMNLYYQSRGRNPWNCFFKNSALVVATDPSKDRLMSKP